MKQLSYRSGAHILQHISVPNFIPVTPVTIYRTPAFENCGSVLYKLLSIIQYNFSYRTHRNESVFIYLNMSVILNFSLLHLVNAMVRRKWNRCPGSWKTTLGLTRRDILNQNQQRVKKQLPRLVCDPNVRFLVNFRKTSVPENLYSWFLFRSLKFYCISYIILDGIQCSTLHPYSNMLPVLFLSHYVPFYTDFKIETHMVKKLSLIGLFAHSTGIFYLVTLSETWNGSEYRIAIDIRAIKKTSEIAFNSATTFLTPFPKVITQ